LLPRGLTAEHLYQIPPSSPALSALTIQVYEIGLAGLHDGEKAVAASRLADFHAAAAWPVSRASKGQTKTYDLKDRVASARLEGDRLEVHLRQGGFMEFVKLLCPGQERERLSLARLRFEYPPEPPPQKLP
jgi:hypothetical protein